VHLFKAIAPAARARLVARVGDWAWQALVSLLIVVAVGLMIAGYGEAGAAALYRAPDWGAAVGSVVLVAGMILFVASAVKCNIRRLLRHPQLLSIVLWGVGHLLADGGRRDLVLFGGLALWAVLELMAIIRRDGAWRRPSPASRRADWAVVAGGLLLAALAHAAHAWLGVPIAAGGVSAP
jgi:uncharacterized membrane protein